MKDVVTVTLSVLAFVVSLYGVWEKRRETRRQLAIRLSQLVDELNKLSYEHDKLGSELRAAGKVPPPQLASIANGRRTVLCEEAIEISRLLPGGARPSQTRTIASNLARVGEHRRAIALYENVVSANPDSLESVFALRGMGLLLMELGDLQRGRLACEKSLALTASTSSIPAWEAADTCVRWAAGEAALGDQGNPRVPLKKAEQYAAKIELLPRRREMLRRIEETEKYVVSLSPGSERETPDTAVG
nr:hypothetical protein [uncultured Actinoplanes sp.]